MTGRDPLGPIDPYEGDERRRVTWSQVVERIEALEQNLRDHIEKEESFWESMMIVKAQVQAIWNATKWVAVFVVGVAAFWDWIRTHLSLAFK